MGDTVLPKVPKTLGTLLSKAAAISPPPPAPATVGSPIAPVSPAASASSGPLVASSAPAMAAPGAGTIASHLAQMAAATNGGGGQPATVGGASRPDALKKLVQQLERRMCEQENQNFVTVILPASHEAAVQGLAAGKMYAAATKANPSAHGLGPPEITVAAGCFRGLMAAGLPSSADPPTQARFSTMMMVVLRLLNLAPSETYFIHHFQVWETYQKGSTKEVKIAFNISGTATLPNPGMETQELLDAAKAAWTDGTLDKLSAVEPRAYQWMDGEAVASGPVAVRLNRMLRTIFSAAGGQIQIGKAPKGPLARQL